jgi:hypothetical protein
MEPVKLFYSYSHKDEGLREELVNHLTNLERQGVLAPWHDRDIEAGAEWNQEIERHLNESQIILLLISSDFIRSPFCWDKEMARAMERHDAGEAVVIPIILRSCDWKGAPFGKLQGLPKDMKPVKDWSDRDQAFTNVAQAIRRVAEKLVRPLTGSQVDLGAILASLNQAPFMANPLRAEFVRRPAEFDALMRLLLAQDRESPVAITAALSGAGGYGKTMMATAICHDQRIRSTFKDGILWVTLGQSASQLINEITALCRHLSGERESFTGINEATNRLIELLGERDLLLVIDDVWHPDHARPFLQGGPRCARLITTRNLDTLPSNAQSVKVDAMRPSEAIEMLHAGLPASEMQSHDGDGTDETLRRLATRLGEWPLLLGLVSGVLQNRVKHAKQPLPDAIAYVNQALDKRGLTFFDARKTESRDQAFDARAAESRDQAVAKTIGVSLDLLKPAERARYAELAVFPEDVNIPLATLEKFWGKTGEADGFDAAFDTEVLCSLLNQFSLLHSLDLSARTIRLHDVIRTFLRDERKADLSTLNDQLLDAHRHEAGWAELADGEPYLWDHLASHLIEAGRGEELVATVKDWRYLAKKIFLRKSHPVENDLIQAMKYAPDDDPVRALRRTFANTGHLFNRCETRDDLHSTIFSRLQHLDELQAIVQELARYLASPRIVPKFDLPDLPHPALIRTLEGHLGSVRGCAFSPDGKLIVSASDDGALKVWDSETGQSLRTFEGHASLVSGCAFSPDGKLIVSASDDGALKVWDSETGQSLRTLEGHSTVVSGCAFSPDGKLIVSASEDRTLKVWDSETGQLLRTLEGHSSLMMGCAFSPDGKLIVSASSDRTLKVWDAQSGQTLATFFADGPMHCCRVYGEMVAAGGSRGVYFLRLVR